VWSLILRVEIEFWQDIVVCTTIEYKGNTLSHTMPFEGYLNAELPAFIPFLIIRINL
jgi:hypothetical protein